MLFFNVILGFTGAIDNAAQLGFPRSPDSNKHMVLIICGTAALAGIILAVMSMAAVIYLVRRRRQHTDTPQGRWSVLILSGSHSVMFHRFKFRHLDME